MKIQMLKNETSDNIQQYWHMSSSQIIIKGLEFSDTM